MVPAILLMPKMPAGLVVNAANSTPGILFEIALDERSSLDRAEAAGVGYDRTDAFPVTLENGEIASVTSYLATAIDYSLLPHDWYLALVIAGARHHGLDEAHIDRLRKLPYSVDGKTDRGTRLNALKALEAEGFLDLTRLWSD